MTTGATSWTFGLTKRAADAVSLQVLESGQLGRAVRNNEKKRSIDELRTTSYRALVSALQKNALLTSEALSAAADPFAVHQKILTGLPGEALMIAISMSFDSFSEGHRYFGLTHKTAKQRLGDQLEPRESEQVLRVSRAISMATKALGDPEKARRYLRTPNFALGGMTPLDLLRTAEGEQMVLSELQAHADGGPV